MSYLRAVHETGARLTHEVKNVLQSLDNLCFMAQSADASMQLGLRRQLPRLADRLRQMLDKLQSAPPTGEDLLATGGEQVAVTSWWAGLRERFPQAWIEYAPLACGPESMLPGALFDSVADNLLDNARLKQQLEPALRVRVALSADARCLSVFDDGAPVAPGVAAQLLRMPVASSNGFGIGLYQCARWAEACGYALRLAENAPGRVGFELAQNEQGGLDERGAS